VFAAPPAVVPTLSSAALCISIAMDYVHGLLPPSHAVCEQLKCRACTSAVTNGDVAVTNGYVAVTNGYVAVTNGYVAVTNGSVASQVSCLSTGSAGR